MGLAFVAPLFQGVCGCCGDGLAEGGYARIAEWSSE